MVGRKSWSTSNLTEPNEDGLGLAAKAAFNITDMILGYLRYIFGLSGFNSCGIQTAATGSQKLLHV
jgi:hypothetical protein